MYFFQGLISISGDYKQNRWCADVCIQMNKNLRCTGTCKSLSGIVGWDRSRYNFINWQSNYLFLRKVVFTKHFYEVSLNCKFLSLKRLLIIRSIAVCCHGRGFFVRRDNGGVPLRLLIFSRVCYVRSMINFW